MRAWALILAGLAVWWAHFLALYIVASVWPGEAIARWIVLAATLAAVAADVIILRAVAARRPADDLDRWTTRLATAGAALSLLAVTWQALPALLA